MTDSVKIRNERVRVEVTSSDPHVVAHLAAIEAEADRVDEVRRALRLGVDTASQVGVRAEMLALDDARRRILDDTDALRRQLSAIAAATKDAWRDEIERLRTDAVSHLADAIERATGDGRIRDTVAQALAGDTSPLLMVEQRLGAAARAMEAAHERGLQTAVGQMSDVAATLSRLTGTLEANQTSPARGKAFEASLENRLAAAVEGRGDKLTDVRDRPAPNRSKRGDFLAALERSHVTIGIELKNTRTGPSAEGARQLVKEICEARDCQAALIVAATPESMPAGLRGATLGLVGERGVAVCMGPDEDQRILESAYSLARSIACLEDRRQCADTTGTDVDEILTALDRIKKNIGVLVETETYLKVAVKDINAQAKRIARRTTEALAEIEKLASGLMKASEANASDPQLW